MKNFFRLLIVAVLMLIAAPAFSASQMHAVQIFMCQQDEEASSADIMAVSKTWLDAAKKVKGGENLQVYVRFPIAAQMGEHDFKFIIAAPNFEEWGAFTDAYEASEVAKVDKQFAEYADCTDAMLWEGIEIK